MSWVGFENLGQQFAPLADAQLKQAYNDYQAQKDLAASQRQLEQDKINAQEAAIKYGVKSPLTNRVEVDPIVAKQLGATPAKEGEDPLAHMQDFIGQLNKQYPGVVDENGTVEPTVYGHLMEMRKAQAALEQKAAALAEKKKYEMDLIDKKQKNALQLESVRNKNIASRQKRGLSTQEKQILDEINILVRAQNQAFMEPEQKMQIQAQIEALKQNLNIPVAQVKQSVAPVAPVQPKKEAMAKEIVNTPVVDNAYEKWLAKHEAKDTKVNRDFFQKAIKAK